MGSPNYHGLDHDCGVKPWKTRSDVTRRFLIQILVGAS
jgi:hypothetical protein